MQSRYLLQIIDDSLFLDLACLVKHYFNMYRSRLILQNAASKAAAAKAAGESSAAATKHIELLNKGVSFDQKTAAQILSSRNSSLYKPLYHHIDPTLLLPRMPGSFSYFLHHLLSSVSGLYSICFSQQSRDKFLHLTARNPDNNNKDRSEDESGEENTSIINTFVLNQSDTGFMGIMTLYHDLSSPLFDETNFDTETHVRQLLNGCSFALEQFHTVQADYLKTIESALDNSKKETEESNTTEGEGEEEEEKQFQYKFFDIAESDPESTENTLVSMLSPEGLDRIFFDTAMYSLVKNVNVHIVEGDESAAGNDTSLAGLPSDPKVMHACLLSARVEEIEAKENEARRNAEDNDPNAPLEDESLQPFAETRDDRKSQTVLQLEVLYDLEFLSNNDEADNNKSFKSVNVAKFETCLKGNPNGDELQWRLCSWRPALEFGHR